MTMRIPLILVLFLALLSPNVSRGQTSSDLYYKAKSILMYNRNLLQGLKYINKCIRSYPSDSAYLLRGSYKEILGIRGIKKDYLRALALSHRPEDSASIFFSLGRVEITSDTLAAFNDYSQACKLNPSADYFNAIGDIMLGTKNYKMAITYYTMQINLGPDSSSSSYYPYSYRGIAKYFLNDFNGALSDLDMGIHYDSNCPWCYEFKIKTLDKLGRLNEACKYLDKMKDLFAENDKTLLLLKENCNK